MIPRWLLVLVMIGLACSCRRPGSPYPTPPPPKIPPNTLIGGIFITSKGTWTHSDRGVTRTVTVTKHGEEIAWTDEYTPSLNGYHSGKFQLDSPESPWFIHVESNERIWIFDGSANLRSRTISGPSVDDQPVISSGRLEPSAPHPPSEVSPRLPASLRELISHPTNPSI